MPKITIKVPYLVPFWLNMPIIGIIIFLCIEILNLLASHMSHISNLLK